MEDKIYTLEEMRSLGIDTLKYKLMDEPRPEPALRSP